MNSSPVQKIARPTGEALFANVTEFQLWIVVFSPMNMIFGRVFEALVTAGALVLFFIGMSVALMVQNSRFLCKFFAAQLTLVALGIVQFLVLLQVAGVAELLAAVCAAKSLFVLDFVTLTLCQRLKDLSTVLTHCFRGGVFGGLQIDT